MFRALPLAIILGILGATWSPVAAQSPDIAAVRAGYLESLRGLQSFDCQFRIERTFSDRALRNNDSMFAAMDVRLWQQGNQQARQIDHYNHRGELLTRAWTGFDGRQFASWEDAAGSLEDKRHLPFGHVQHQPINSLWSLESIDCLLGVNLSTGKLGLPQLFEQQAGRIAGWKSIAGQRCVEVIFPEVPLFPERPQVHRMQVTAWHDPEAGYLPRQIVVQSADKADNGTFPVWTYRTAEYRDITDAVGKTHRFPAEGVLESDLGEARLTVTAVRVNEALPAESFAPQFPDLTLVREQLPNRPERKYVVGDKQLRERLEQQFLERDWAAAIARQTAAATSVPATTVSARPGDVQAATRRGWQMIAVGAALALLVTAWLIRRNHSRPT